jgi:3-isopropylmalate/(R)-2-methylmalate dehydratase small subunit
VDHGFRAVIASSFADILSSNATKLGLLSVRRGEGEEECRRVAAAGQARIDLERQTVTAGGETLPFHIDPARGTACSTASTEIGLTLEQAERIDRFEAEGDGTWDGPSSLDLPAEPLPSTSVP